MTLKSFSFQFHKSIKLARGKNLQRGICEANQNSEIEMAIKMKAPQSAHRTSASRCTVSPGNKNNLNSRPMRCFLMRTFFAILLIFLLRLRLLINSTKRSFYCAKKDEKKLHRAYFLSHCIIYALFSVARGEREASSNVFLFHHRFDK